MFEQKVLLNKFSSCSKIVEAVKVKNEGNFSPF